MFKKQPKIDVKPDEKDRKILLVGWVLVVLNFILVLSFYFKLPDTIPVHFNLRGEADVYGNKSTLWMLPIVCLVIYYGMTLVTTKIKPWQFNYPVKVTENNAPKLYGMSIKMMVWLNFGIAITFLVITLEVILKAVKIEDFSLGWLFVPVIAVVTLLPFWFIYKMFKVPKT